MRGKGRESIEELNVRAIRRKLYMCRQSEEIGFYYSGFGRKESNELKEFEATLGL